MSDVVLLQILLAALLMFIAPTEKIETMKAPSGTSNVLGVGVTAMPAIDKSKEIKDLEEYIDALKGASAIEQRSIELSDKYPLSNIEQVRQSIVDRNNKIADLQRQLAELTAP